MRKLVIILVMMMVTLAAFATPKVIRESKWNNECYTYILMYDEDNLYGGSYYIYRHCFFYGEEQYDKMIGKDILKYWIERENNSTGRDLDYDFTDEKTMFSQEENKFVNYVRVTRR